MVPLRSNVALVRNLHTRHSNARYAKLNYSGATIEDKTLESLLTQRYSHIANCVHKVKSKFESLGTFSRDLLLKPYAMLNM